LDSEAGGAVEHELMQASSTNAYAGCGTKEALGRGRRVGCVEEADSPKRSVFGCIEINAETSKGFDGRRHQAFAACLVDGWAVGVGDDDGEPPRRRCNGCGETGRAGPGDEEIRSVQRIRPFVIRNAGD
jgi:hypothetical protein